ncbi:hypothetical protein [Pseudoalteromonas phenolica]|uniref:hypothetical protein n=1 Tax=Pseudoalteromonas phenolica TaxID=161398 RepID=UPI00110AECEC|nr:hypothetical protein [Pseudoalteromonas phenolica]TMO54385.1 hypothetical protein CWC21_15735 [Pseudoalteromonas phenolica]
MKLILWVLLALSIPAFASNVHPEHLQVFTDEANKTEQWQRGNTKRFDTFEQFFLTRDHDPYYRTGYIYDMHNERVLSYQESLAINPSFEAITIDESKGFNIPKQELVAFLNITPPTSGQYFYFYFDSLTQKNGSGRYLWADNPDRRGFLVRGMEKRQKAARIMQAHKSIPWYLIHIPFIGYKPPL